LQCCFEELVVAHFAKHIYFSSSRMVFALTNRTEKELMQPFVKVSVFSFKTGTFSKSQFSYRQHRVFIARS